MYRQFFKESVGYDQDPLSVLTSIRTVNWFLKITFNLGYLTIRLRACDFYEFGGMNYCLIEIESE